MLLPDENVRLSSFAARNVSPTAWNEDATLLAPRNVSIEQYNWHATLSSKEIELHTFPSFPPRSPRQRKQAFPENSIASLRLRTSS